MTTENLTGRNFLSKTGGVVRQIRVSNNLLSRDAIIYISINASKIALFLLRIIIILSLFLNIFLLNVLDQSICDIHLDVVWM